MAVPRFQSQRWLVSRVSTPGDTDGAAPAASSPIVAGSLPGGERTVALEADARGAGRPTFKEVHPCLNLSAGRR